MEEKNYICIICPKSCHLKVKPTNQGIEVSGYGCKRGLAHGEKEYLNPSRMLTTTVVVNHPSIKRLPVVSSDEIPKNKMEACLRILYEQKVSIPVKCGDVIVKNICDTGVDILASRTLG